MKKKKQCMVYIFEGEKIQKVISNYLAQNWHPGFFVCYKYCIVMYIFWSKFVRPSFATSQIGFYRKLVKLQNNGRTHWFKRYWYSSGRKCILVLSKILKFNVNFITKTRMKKLGIDILCGMSSTKIFNSPG